MHTVCIADSGRSRKLEHWKGVVLEGEEEEEEDKDEDGEEEEEI